MTVGTGIKLRQVYTEICFQNIHQVKQLQSAVPKNINTIRLTEIPRERCFKTDTIYEGKYEAKPEIPES